MEQVPTQSQDEHDEEGVMGTVEDRTSSRSVNKNGTPAWLNKPLVMRPLEKSNPKLVLTPSTPTFTAPRIPEAPIGELGALVRTSDLLVPKSGLVIMTLREYEGMNREIQELRKRNAAILAARESMQEIGVQASAGEELMPALQVEEAATSSRRGRGRPSSVNKYKKKN